MNHRPVLTTIFVTAMLGNAVASAGSAAPREGNKERGASPAATESTTHGGGVFGIQAEVNPVASLLAMQSNHWGNIPLLPSFEMGFRLYPSDRVGIDVMMGFSTESDVEEDSAAHTEESLGATVLFPEVGLSVRLADRRGASLVLVTRCGLLLQKEYDYVDNSGYVDDPYGGAYYHDDYTHVEYWMTTPTIYAGLEPSVTPGGGFELYMGFGARLMFVPDSRYVDEDDPDFDFEEEVFPMESREDSHVRFSFSGLAVGVRFRF